MIVGRETEQPKGEKMPIEFDPQFHKKITQSEKNSVWVALPHPRTVIPVKTMFYRKWQFEECLRLQEAGEIVLTLPLSF
jgi:hypothetical protein